MTNDGRSLEDVVTLIEGQAGPRGFRVERRKPVYSETGVQIAEFDILLIGQIGTAPVTFLIECRDRPSEGPAPAAWIEQLIGRRTRFRFDKVMAVSSTGFSEGAVAAARDAGIEVRTLDNLTPEEVVDWLPPNAPVLIRHGMPTAARIYAWAKEGTKERLVSLKSDAANLVCDGSGERVSISTLWDRLVNQNSVWASVPEGGPPVQRTVVVGDHLAERFSVEIDGAAVPVERLEVDATLHAYFPRMPLVQAAEYSGPGDSSCGGKERYARLGRWEGPAEGPIAAITLIGHIKRSGDIEPPAPTDD
jgi:hypothetical protein